MTSPFFFLSFFLVMGEPPKYLLSGNVSLGITPQRNLMYSFCWQFVYLTYPVRQHTPTDGFLGDDVRFVLSVI
ncbi:hypothetical protein B0O99DRAFT_643386 [Bisporella sp. PMI_857]|nr:hypothetical protein B0O99DRAFT_643386 [Bisporella sp. PMI_857]